MTENIGLILRTSGKGRELNENKMIKILGAVFTPGWQF